MKKIFLSALSLMLMQSSLVPLSTLALPSKTLPQGQSNIKSNIKSDIECNRKRNKKPDTAYNSQSNEEYRNIGNDCCIAIPTTHTHNSKDYSLHVNAKRLIITADSVYEIFYGKDAIDCEKSNNQYLYFIPIHDEHAVDLRFLRMAKNGAPEELKNLLVMRSATPQYSTNDNTILTLSDGFQHQCKLNGEDERKRRNYTEKILREYQKEQASISNYEGQSSNNVLSNEEQRFVKCESKRFEELYNSIANIRELLKQHTISFIDQTATICIDQLLRFFPQELAFYCDNEYDHSFQGNIERSFKIEFITEIERILNQNIYHVAKNAPSHEYRNIINKAILQLTGRIEMTKLLRTQINFLAQLLSFSHINQLRTVVIYVHETNQPTYSYGYVYVHGLIHRVRQYIYTKLIDDVNCYADQIKQAEPTRGCETIYQCICPCLSANRYSDQSNKHSPDTEHAPAQQALKDLEIKHEQSMTKLNAYAHARTKNNVRIYSNIDMQDIPEPLIRQKKITPAQYNEVLTTTKNASQEPYIRKAASKTTTVIKRILTTINH